MFRGIALHDSGDNFHERGLARAIFTEQQVDLAGLNGQIAIPQRSDAAVPFFDVVEFEEHRKRNQFTTVSGRYMVAWVKVLSRDPTTGLRKGARLTRRKRNPNAHRNTKGSN